MSATLSVTPLERLRTYASFVRFEHTLFSLPLVLAGVFAQRGPALHWSRWLLILGAAVGARTAALALNRIIDRRLDALNPRTRDRELPSGRMRMTEALGLLAAGCALYFGCAAALHPLCLRLSPVPLVAFAVYPYLKRFTPLCHFGVGFALALAPLGGYLAAHPGLERPLPAILLAMFALLWVGGFDIIYAQLDERFDREYRVRSLVERLGRARALQVSWWLHLLAAVAQGGAAVILMRRGPSPAPLWAEVLTYLLSGGVAGLLFAEQRNAGNVGLAFFKINVLVGFGVLALVLVARWAGGW